LVVAGDPLGVLNCYHKDPYSFQSQEILLVETIANQASIAIEATNLRAREREQIARLEAMNTELREREKTQHRVAKIHRELMQLVFRGAGLSGITDALSNTIECDIVIEDEEGDVISSHARAADSTVLAPALREACYMDGERDTSLREGTAVIKCEGMSSNQLDGFMVPVLHDDALVGRVWAFDPQRPLTPLDQRSLERGALVVALELLRLRAVRDTESRITEDFFEQLVRSEDTNASAFNARARSLGLNPMEPFQLLLVGRPSELSDMQGKHDQFRLADSPPTRILQRFAQRSSEALLVAARDDHIVVLRQETGASSRPVEFANTLRRELGAYQASKDFNIIVGPRSMSLAHIPAAYRLSFSALQVVNRGSMHNRVVQMEDLGIARLILQAQSPDDLADFARGILQPLRDYDAKRGASLVETLRAYIAEGFGTTATAASLHVHPNTVVYRLGQIRNLISEDARNPQVLLKLQLALTIHDLLGSGHSDAASRKVTGTTNHLTH
jgi:sugar diacid utilization regulator